jgi:hypothetical protein
MGRGGSPVSKTNDRFYPFLNFHHIADILLAATVYGENNTEQLGTPDDFKKVSE